MAPSRLNLLVVTLSDTVPLIRHILEQEGYRIMAATDVGEAATLLSRETIDLTIFDETLFPEQDDPETAAHKFIRNLKMPLVLLEAGRNVADRISALLPDWTKDIVQKPIAPDELIRRIWILVRPENGKAVPESLFYSGVEVNLRTHRIYRDGHRIDTSPLEFRLLHHLIQSPGQVFTRKELQDAAWPRSVYVEPRTVDVHIGKLRKALMNRGPNLIRTVRSRGYSLDNED